MTDSMAPQIDVADAEALVNPGRALLLDVREDFEWAAGVSAVNLTGGISAWHASGRAVVRDDGSVGTVA